MTEVHSGDRDAATPGSADQTTPVARVNLHDRYTKRDGRILLTGVHALVRLTLLQAERDQKAGLKTGGYVSGYRGSPLGALDQAFDSAAPLPAEHGIVVRPAVNEELAATAVAGTQQIERSEGAKVQGVFALWYGKGPGLDRASDAIRHGNAQGSSQYGGVVLAVGDDHTAKSSSVVCYSDETVVSLGVPLLSPSDAREIVLFGLHGFAASRASGSWMALKILNEVADTTRSVRADELSATFDVPDVPAPPGGLHNRWPIMPLDQEALQLDYRLPAVLAYARANKLDRMIKPDGARVGIVASGKSWLDLLEAFHLLGLDQQRQRELGLALYKPGLIWPLEPEGLSTFAAGLERLIVVEEKGGMIEGQIKSLLYGVPGAPAVFGKHDAVGATLFSAKADLAPERIAPALMRIVPGIDAMVDPAALAKLGSGLSAQVEFAAPPVSRRPFFCSGCPHNRSTVLPEGSRAMAGIGCHGLAAYNNADTGTFAQMGGEGVHWVGLSPFTDERHVFANMGDGTYFHSGLLAIRQAVSANVNITLKLLYNSAVAMTGGQAIDGELSVQTLVEQVRAEGVKHIRLVADDLERYPESAPVRRLVDGVAHRDDLDAVQRELRDTPGVSVIVYDQMCATEKRRMRKRGRLADPEIRPFINELVCEGCGDCSRKSNCLSVEPIPTAFGDKRKINQSSCNKDYSCLEGFCPSFVSVQGGKIRKPAKAASVQSVVLPPPPALNAEQQKLLVAGVGGTGVVTIGALLSMAEYLKGRQVAVLDQIGLAQKGGAVTSHIQLGGEIQASRITPGEADLVIACDLIVGNSRDIIAAVERGHTYVVANADVAITGDFTKNSAATPDGRFLAGRLLRATGEDRFAALPFTRISERLFGDAIGSNLMMVGFAYQKGWLSFDVDAFLEAIRLNKVAVEMNISAFEWGRRLAVDAAGVYETIKVSEPEPETLEAMIERRGRFLEAYQDRAYADRFRKRVDAVRAAEKTVSEGEELTDAVARSLFKLMAYKDEYEVARLFRSEDFKRSLAEQFEGPFKLHFHLAPPTLGQGDGKGNPPKKRRFGGWMMPAFGVLAKLKRLRGTPLDPFGYTAERRLERRLIAEFEALIDGLLPRATPANLAKVIEIARLPMTVRGYGHVKDKAAADYHAEMARLLGALDQAPAETIKAAS